MKNLELAIEEMAKLSELDRRRYEYIIKFYKILNIIRQSEGVKKNEQLVCPYCSINLMEDSYPNSNKRSTKKKIK